MKGTIGLEEHFSHPDTLGDSEEYFLEGKWSEMKRRLLDVGDLRLRLMDQNGIELMIVSLNAPAIQAISDVPKAIEVAKRANDMLAEHVAKRPDRFRAFAALPMQDPGAAALEARRCIVELGFVGALVNGFSQVGDEETVVYLDDRRYSEFWSEFVTLDRPFYLHPRDPIASRCSIYQDHPWLLGSAWAFGVETATHALRLMGSGLFDRHPGLQIILGHHGEGLPFLIWRVDHRVATAPRGIQIKKTFQQYFHQNFYLTTSGSFRTQALINAISEIGSDRVLFSTDYPFEELSDAAAWFDRASIAENDREKIGRRNALRLFRLVD
ncbi:gamma-resorcylate decarboxylase [freshwater sediment metagenome]|uniref:Gamma-resorcylate decarboxylase n=1 Tax=freshwater sediment metagenome TaxID=556182 RepID=A0AA48M5G8_9ZZZZ